MPTKTPQEKKRLSLTKDRRNGYGEHNKSSRKAIRRNKSADIRTERRAQERSVELAVGTKDVDGLDALENEVRATSPRRWRKLPDAPLMQVVKAKLSRRVASIGAKAARRAKR